MIDQDHRLGREITLLKILMNLNKARKILSEMILLTYHTLVLEFSLVLFTLSSRLLGFLTTFFKRILLGFILVIFFLPLGCLDEVV